jgi:hypothetical protein
VSSALSIPGSGDGTKVAKAIVAEMDGGLVGAATGTGCSATRNSQKSRSKHYTYFHSIDRDRSIISLVD